jgi:hypothetical protein
MDGIPLTPVSLDLSLHPRWECCSRWHALVTGSHLWLNWPSRLPRQNWVVNPVPAKFKLMFWVGSRNLAENKLLVVTHCLLLLWISGSMCCLWWTWYGIMFMICVECVTCFVQGSMPCLIQSYANLIAMPCCYFTFFETYVLRVWKYSTFWRWA